ncbi:hypothetical protein SVAN01_02359 [Stagonosporopsis vannaccii]|nr:hypothetical protein SVAN01_02359 [Stagonosporopsis vannaccii]
MIRGGAMHSAQSIACAVISSGMRALVSPGERFRAVEPFNPTALRVATSGAASSAGAAAETCMIPWIDGVQTMQHRRRVARTCRQQRAIVFNRSHSAPFSSSGRLIEMEHRASPHVPPAPSVQRCGGEQRPPVQGAPAAENGHGGFRHATTGCESQRGVQPVQLDDRSSALWKRYQPLPLTFPACNPAAAWLREGCAPRALRREALVGRPRRLAVQALRFRWYAGRSAEGAQHPNAPMRRVAGGTLAARGGPVAAAPQTCWLLRALAGALAQQNSGSPAYHVPLRSMGRGGQRWTKACIGSALELTGGGILLGFAH